MNNVSYTCVNWAWGFTTVKSLLSVNLVVIIIRAWYEVLTKFKHIEFFFYNIDGEKSATIAKYHFLFKDLRIVFYKSQVNISSTILPFKINVLYMSNLVLNYIWHTVLNSLNKIWYYFFFIQLIYVTVVREWVTIIHILILLLIIHHWLIFSYTTLTKHLIKL